MYFSKNRKKTKKTSTPEVPEKKLGKDISLSSLDDLNCKHYIGPIDKRYTERFQYTKSDRKDKMESIKKTQTSKKSEGLDKVSQIRMDTGIIEIGYDKDTEQVVFSFVKDRYFKEQNRVIEDSTKYKKVYESEKFNSVDDSFTTGSIEFKSSLYKSRAMLSEQFKKLSNDNDEYTTVDKVVPFKNTDYEERRINQIRESKSESNVDRTEKHTAMSMLSNSKQIKEYKGKQLEKDFEKAVLKAREKIKNDGIINDDYIIYLKKKWLALQGVSEPIKPLNTNSNKEDNILEELNNEVYAKRENKDANSNAYNNDVNTKENVSENNDRKGAGQHVQTETSQVFGRKSNIDNSESEKGKGVAAGVDDSDNNGNSKNGTNFFEEFMEGITGDSSVKKGTKSKSESNHSIEANEEIAEGEPIESPDLSSEADDSEEDNDSNIFKKVIEGITGASVVKASKKAKKKPVSSNKSNKEVSEEKTVKNETKDNT